MVVPLRLFYYLIIARNQTHIKLGMFKETKNKVKTIVKTGNNAQPLRLNGPQRLKESSLIVVVLTSILLFVALITFNEADPSWSQTAWGGEVNNAGGVFGAWLADSLFFSFGLLAYTIPLLITLFGWVLFRKRAEDEPVDFMIWGSRLLGLTLLVLTSCGLADINFDDIWYFSSGGVIGDVLSNLAIPILNVLGTTLVLLFLWGAGFTLLTGISWLNLVDSIGSSTLRIISHFINLFRGTSKEVLEPQLYESNVASEIQEDNGLDVTSSGSEVEGNDSKRHDRQFNIHIPETVTQIERTLSNQSGVESEVVEPLKAQFDNDRISELVMRKDELLQSTIAEIETEMNDDIAQEDIEQVSHVTYSDRLDGSVGSEDKVESKEEDLSWHESRIGEVVTEPSIKAEELNTIVEEVELKHIERDIDFASINEEQDADHDQESPGSHNLDDDAAAFQELVTEAQEKRAAKQNPFLVQKESNLPVPDEPLPTLELLYHPEKRENFIDREALENIARLVEAKLADYKIKATVVDIFPGPVITRFELDLAPGVKVSRISSLSMDLARSLSAMAVRVVEVIPGKPYVGLELPNMSRQTVYFSDVVGSPQFQTAKSPTTVVLGQDIAGEALVADLAKMPHVLVAGTTGSGKSVGVNVMILSMLYKAGPEDVRFIMIDPKMLELSVYEGIPHLLSEVVTDMKDASNALRWCVGEMERRYKLMSALGVRNIKGFNDKLKMASEAGHPIHDPLWQEGDSMDELPPLLEKLPYIVVIVDEFADLMMVVGKKVEELIARLAQKARAAGIHLILATQRPSVDVITGLIKANIPTRVAFTVSTKTDSRTILDQGGAESLLGMGDMLYLPPGSSHTVRVHGAFASDDDVHSVVNNWKARGKPQYIDEITSGDQGSESLLPGEKPEGEEETDPLFDQVVEHVVQSRRGSVSGVQRRFKIGYNRAARIVEQLEAHGIVSAPGHNGNREVLAPAPGREVN